MNSDPRTRTLQPRSSALLVVTGWIALIFIQFADIARADSPENLAALLRTGSESERIAAARILAQEPPEDLSRIYDAILSALSDSVEEVRFSGLAVLGSSGESVGGISG